MTGPLNTCAVRACVYKIRSKRESGERLMADRLRAERANGAAIAAGGTNHAVALNSAGASQADYRALANPSSASDHGVEEWSNRARGAFGVEIEDTIRDGSNHSIYNPGLRRSDAVAFPSSWT